MQLSAWCVLALAALTPADPDLDRAQRHIGALELDEAARALKAVEAKSGLTHSEVLSFYELTGLVAGLTGRAPQAIEAFTRLLVLDPNAKLTGRHPPRATTPFFEAKAAAREQGALSLTVSTDTEDHFLSKLTLTFTGAQQQAALVRLELLEDGIARSLTVPTSQHIVAVHARALSVRATVLSAKQWSLLELPALTFEGPAAPAPLELSKVELPPTDPIGMKSAGEPPRPRLRPLAYSLLAAGAAAAAVGVFFGIRNRSARETLDSPPLVDGKVTFTRAEAIALDQQASSSAIIANTLFISAGAVFVAGAIIWVWGLFDRTPVSLTSHGSSLGTAW